jgi:hypothetical protein
MDTRRETARICPAPAKLWWARRPGKLGGRGTFSKQRESYAREAGDCPGGSEKRWSIRHPVFRWQSSACRGRKVERTRLVARPGAVAGDWACTRDDASPDSRPRVNNQHRPKLQTTDTPPHPTPITSAAPLFASPASSLLPLSQLHPLTLRLASAAPL